MTGRMYTVEQCRIKVVEFCPEFGLPTAPSLDLLVSWRPLGALEGPEGNAHTPSHPPILTGGMNPVVG